MTSVIENGQFSEWRLQPGIPLLCQDLPTSSFEFPQDDIHRQVKLRYVLAEIDLLLLGIQHTLGVQQAPRGIDPLQQGIFRYEGIERHLLAASHPGISRCR